MYRLISVDTETLGLDLHHGARPYLVTMYTDTNEQLCWEWDVDPVRRRPIVPYEDLVGIGNCIFGAVGDDGPELVLQNGKFDVAMLTKLYEDHGQSITWPWHRMHDTLIAAHLLASNQPHGLDHLSMQYLGIDIGKYEKVMRDHCLKARSVVRSKANAQLFEGWRIARQGLFDMPSVKGSSKRDEDKPWKNDTWLPRMVAKKLWGESEAGKYWSENIKVIKSGARGAERNIFRRLSSLDELRDKCKILSGWEYRPPETQSVDDQGHPWWTVTAEYANTDSFVTCKLWPVMKRELQRRNLWKLYLQSMKIPPIICAMEQQGITGNESRLLELAKSYKDYSTEASLILKNIAASYGYDLVLPKNGVNDSLRTFCFDILKLPHVRNPKARSSAPSLDAKNAIPYYQQTLRPRSKELTFINKLVAKRARDTSLSFMEAYQRFWLPIGEGYDPQWRALYPSLNPTGTNTLRFSMANPNAQQISKRGIDQMCPRCEGEGCEKCYDGTVSYNLRYIFGPLPGDEWWSCDGKNLELRIPAYESGEEEFIALFERPDDPPYFGSNHLLISHILLPQKFEECLSCTKCKKEIWVPTSRTLKESCCKCIGSNPLVDGRIFKKRYDDSLYRRMKAGDFALQYNAVDKEDGTGTADRTYGIPGAQARIKSKFAKQEELNQWCIKFATKHGYIETLPDLTVDPEHGYPLMCTRTQWGKIKPTVPLSYRVQGCLAGSSRVLTDRGLIPIKELVGIECNVWTGFRWARATGLDRGMARRATITLSSGLIIECDTRHKLKDDNDNWREFDNLKVGDLIALPNNQNPIEPSGNINWWFLFGFIIGDGALSNRNGRRGLVLSGGQTKKALLYGIFVFLKRQGYTGNKVKYKDRGGVRWNIRPTTSIRKEKYEVSLENREFADFLEGNGFDYNWRYNTKRVPSSVWTSTLQDQRDFLQGLWMSDGNRTYKAGSGYGLNMKNEELLREVQILSSALGYDAHFTGSQLRFRWRAPNSKSSRKYPSTAILRQVNELLKTNYSLDSLQYRRDKRNYCKVLQGNSISQYEAEKILRNNCDSPQVYRYDSVSSIEVHDYREVTYTMSVDDELHQFVADGVIHANTAMWWMKQCMINCQLQLDEWNRDEAKRLGRLNPYSIVLQIHDELLFRLPKRAHPKKDPKRSNLSRVRILQGIMEQCGMNLIPSIPTPTSIEFHETSWAEGISL